jgi:hypothetical protein
MLTVDHYAKIRQARRDGLTIRQIAEQLGHSTKTIIKALAEPEPRPYAPTQSRPAPVFGPFRQVVDGILAADATAPRKQRHFIRVLQLLAHHPLPRVEQAILACRGPAVPDADAITAQAERLARGDGGKRDMPLSLTDGELSPGAARLVAVCVPAPDLAQFNRLLSLNP